MVFEKGRQQKGFAEVTSSKVNRGAGYGLEIPCVYRLVEGLSANVIVTNVSIIITVIKILLLI